MPRWNPAVECYCSHCEANIPKEDIVLSKGSTPHSLCPNCHQQVRVKPRNSKYSVKIEDEL